MTTPKNITPQKAGPLTPTSSRMTTAHRVCHCVRINDIPEEIMERIMSYLCPYTDCKSAALVCSMWHRLMQGVIRQREQTFYVAARLGALKWSSSEGNSNSRPYGRFMHSACCVEGAVYVFGGTTCSESLHSRVASETSFCDLWKLELASRTWTRLTASGKYPTPKAAASMVYCRDSLILFGGLAPPVPNPPHQLPHFYDELHVYDIAANQWRAVVSSSCPPPMAGHRASMVGDLMIVFGGGCNSQSKYNDIWVLSIQTMIWSCMHITGRKPSPRDKHVQVVLGDGHILIIGGLGSNDKVLTDAWLLDISEFPWCWREVNISGSPDSVAPQIFSHGACKIGDCVVFFSKLRSRPGSLGLARRPFPRPHHQQQQGSHRPQSSSSRGRPSSLERGSIKDIRHPSRESGEAVDVKGPPDETTVDSSLLGCPCSRDCTCRTPVPLGALVKKLPPRSDPSTSVRVTHGDQQYVLDVSPVVGETRAVWLDVNPQQDVSFSPVSIDAGLRTHERHVAESLFPSVCVGRAEIIRFGGILKNPAPKVINEQYFAY